MKDYLSLPIILGRFVEEHTDSVARGDNHKHFRRRSLDFTDEFHNVEGATLEFFHRKKSESGIKNIEIGMNSPGILLDRITILTIKKAMLPDYQAAAEVDEAIIDMLSVFENCGYAKRHLLKKQSGVEIELGGFGHTLLHLLASNLRMWLSQEIFYLGVSPEDLGYTVNDFVELWGFENQYRNACIDRIEISFTPDS